MDTPTDPTTLRARLAAPAAAPLDLDALRFVLLDTVSALATEAASTEAQARGQAPDHALDHAPDHALDQALDRAQDRAADGPGALHVLAAVLVRAAAEPPAAGAVDELVGLATTIVYGAGDTDPATAGVDRLVLAVAHLLRARLQPGAGDADRVTAAGHLLAAAELLPAGHPAAATVVSAAPAFVGAAGPYAARLAAALAPARTAGALRADAPP
ncbi:hypothetical protein AB0J72_52105 [Dactylosporangium sp. NPDC049742]|uniref:hypothetical protein n=1 Tax=Dactylosporangium sp. NPDC049742 TaxID=3154737 RepID=UPI0034200B86